MLVFWGVHRETRKYPLQKWAIFSFMAFVEASVQKRVHDAVTYAVISARGYHRITSGSRYSELITLKTK